MCFSVPFKIWDSIVLQSWAFGDNFYNLSFIFLPCTSSRLWHFIPCRMWGWLRLTEKVAEASSWSLSLKYISNSEIKSAINKLLLISKSNNISLHCLPDFHGKGLQTTLLPDWHLWCWDCDSCPAEQHYTIKCWAIWSFWLCSFIFSLVLQIPMPCFLVPRGRHFCNFDSLPNIF